MSHRVFVYGTLKRGFYNHKHISSSNATYLGDRTTSTRYPLFVDFYKIPYLVNAPNEPFCKPIAGELYNIDDATLQTLDVLEGVAAKRYERVSVNLDDEKEPCWIYLLPNREELQLSKRETITSYTKEIHEGYVPPGDRRDMSRFNSAWGGFQ